MHRGKGMKFVGDSRIPLNRSKNVPKDYSEYPGKTEAFLPNFLLKEWMVGAVFLVGFLVFIIASPPPLEREADPLAAGYTPLPDWYFLFLYQFLKYTYASGHYVVLGTVVFPGLGALALLLAPWLDRGPERRIAKRPIASGMMLLALISIFFLTWQSSVTHNWEHIEQQGQIQPTADIDKSSKGYKIYANQTCINCHGENLQGKIGPALIGIDKSVKEIKHIAKNGIGKMPAGQFQGTEEQLETLAKFIAGLGASGGGGGSAGE
ncbi:MAG TPA: c-type cytochrome [Bacillales bacterium]|nr:c-type cytochrome [Bacillales bacterium]